MADLAVIDAKTFPAPQRSCAFGRRVVPVFDRRNAPWAATIAAALSLSAFATVAAAHEMNIFVQRVEGAAIHGRVYFKGGAAAQGVAVRATDSQGNSLGETTTDADGQFVFVAKTRCDHHFSAELEDGHATRRPALVRREQLPANLPGPAHLSSEPHSASPAAASNEEQRTSAAEPLLPGEGSPAAAQRSPATPSAAPAGVTDESAQPLGGVSAASVAAQLDDIRERLERMETAVRWRDLLGGVGYILGAAGIAFYLMARRPPQESAR